MLEEDLQQFLQAESARAAIHQGHIIDVEAVFEGGVTVQLFEHRIRAEPGLDLDDQAQSAGAIGEVVDIRDAREFFRLHAVFDFLDDTLRPHQVGQLGDDETHLASRDAFDRDLRSGLERAPAGGVGVCDARKSDDRAPRRQIGPGYERHEIFERGIRMLEQVTGGTHHLDEVVGSHVRRHPHRYSARAVDEEVGKGCGENFGLQELIVVVGYEVDHVFIEAVGHRERGGLQSSLGVAGGGWTVVE